MNGYPVEVVITEIADDEQCEILLQELLAAHESASVRLLDVLLITRVEEELAFSTPEALPDDEIEFGVALTAILGLDSAAEMTGVDTTGDEDSDPDVPGEETSASAVSEADPGSLTAEDVWQALTTVNAGRMAMVALIEHTWMGDLRSTADELGGAVLLQGRLDTGLVQDWDETIQDEDAAEVSPLDDGDVDLDEFREFEVAAEAELAEQVDGVFAEAEAGETSEAESAVADC